MALVLRMRFVLLHFLVLVSGLTSSCTTLIKFSTLTYAKPEIQLQIIVVQNFQAN